MASDKVYIISKTIYYDSLNKCYKNILIIDRIPEGDLKNKIKIINNTKLSSFQENTPCSNYQQCLYAITDLNNISSCRNVCNNFLDINKQGDLITYLLKNNYIVDTDLTRLLIENNTIKDIVFAIKYNS